MSKYYSINEFSKILGVSAQTLRNWDTNDKLKPHHTSPNGYRYYSHEQLNQVININYQEKNNNIDEIYVNTIISISNLFYGSVSEEIQQTINKIKELIEGGEEDDKRNKGNVNT